MLKPHTPVVITEHPDGYSLWEKLKEGQAVTVQYNGRTYTLQFKGQEIGQDNYLLAERGDGETRKYGWGWRPDLVMNAVDDIESGWTGPQVPRYTPFSSSESNDNND